VTSPTVAIVDYGMGNLTSVARAFENLYADVTVTAKVGDLERADRIVLPGVGAFGEGIRALRELGLVDALEAEVRARRKPLLGICLGMELLARESAEHGHHQGLGWIDARVRPIAPRDPALKAIHIGWNDVRPVRPSPLLDGLGPAPDFYFVHQYHLDCREPSVVVAVAEYGGPIVAAVQRDNVFGVQFHPEKSQEAGLALLRNFLRWEGGRPC
jgi:glutamine amidotransferase